MLVLFASGAILVAVYCLHREWKAAGKGGIPLIGSAIDAIAPTIQSNLAVSSDGKEVKPAEKKALPLKDSNQASDSKQNSQSTDKKESKKKKKRSKTSKHRSLDDNNPDVLKKEKKRSKKKSKRRSSKKSKTVEDQSTDVRSTGTTGTVDDSKDKLPSPATNADPAVTPPEIATALVESYGVSSK
uniref:Uncharacterized protein n=1 Tax=Steinernema glaseri TaxID=37863 RepID=A0A1I7YP31_9BILA